MPKKLVGITGLIPFLLLAQEPEIIEHNLPDDGFVQIDLQFSFPYGGNLYTTSFMGSNGVLMLMDPVGTAGQWSYCCNGQDLSLGSAPSFVIMPLWTDLINYNNEGKFYSQGNDEWQRYMWYNLSEYYYNNWQNKNTFGTQLDYLGNISFFYEQLNITGHQVTIGYTGDLSDDSSAYNQYYHDYGISTDDVEVDENYELKIYQVSVVEEEPEPTFEETYIDDFVDSMINDSFGTTSDYGYEEPYTYEDNMGYEEMTYETTEYVEEPIYEEVTYNEVFEDLYVDEILEVYTPVTLEPEVFEEELFVEEILEDPLLEEEIFEEEIFVDEEIEEEIEEAEEVYVLSSDVLEAVLTVLKTDEETMQQQSDNQSMTVDFGNMMNDAIAVGSLDAFLSMELPDYGRFDIQVVETPQMEMAEQSVATMPRANVETMLQDVAQNMQESGGFEDQTGAMLLMNGLSTMSGYYHDALLDNPVFYRERIIYPRALPDARISVLRMNSNDTELYDEMTGMQYGRD
jgi:hypothetical protein